MEATIDENPARGFCVSLYLDLNRRMDAPLTPHLIAGAMRHAEIRRIARCFCERVCRMKGPKGRAQPRFAEPTRQPTSTVKLCKCSMPKHIIVQ
jgi:hypothetical protein